MEAIRTYLDNVFAAFDQTPRMLALKAEMQAGMEEKYHALKLEGKSEHEAVGSVIANFGSIDEIIAELGLTRYETAPEDGISVPRDEAFEYVRVVKKAGLWVGGGVWLIIIGVAIMNALNNFTSLYGGGIFVLLSFIAAAVALFIVNSTRMSQYEDYDESKLRLDPQTRADLEQQAAHFMPRYTAFIAIGVALCILAAGLNGFLIHQVTLGRLIILTNIASASSFLLIVSFAVFMFIYACYQKSSYDVLLGKGEHRYETKMRNKKADRIIGTVAAIYWPSVTAAFLLWSFVGHSWHISWVIWPVAGILFGAFAGGMGAWYSE